MVRRSQKSLRPQRVADRRRLLERVERVAVPPPRLGEGPRGVDEILRVERVRIPVDRVPDRRGQRGEERVVRATRARERPRAVGEVARRRLGGNPNPRGGNLRRHLLAEALEQNPAPLHALRARTRERPRRRRQAPSVERAAFADDQPSQTRERGRDVHRAAAPVRPRQRPREVREVPSVTPTVFVRTAHVMRGYPPGVGGGVWAFDLSVGRRVRRRRVRRRRRRIRRDAFGDAAEERRVRLRPARLRVRPRGGGNALRRERREAERERRASQRVETPGERIGPPIVRRLALSRAS